MARTLEAMPVAADALASGDVSSSAVSLLAHARDASPEAFSRSEAQLVDAARTMPVEELKATVTRWRHDHADEADDDRQELYLSPTLRGRGASARHRHHRCREPGWRKERAGHRSVRRGAPWRAACRRRRDLRGGRAD